MAERYPVEFKPSFYRRYVDNIFVLFELDKSTHSFCKCIFLKFVVKTAHLPLVFTKNQHLVEFSPIMKDSFQRTRRGYFLYTLL